MVNSASEERTETLDMVKERGTPVVLSCTGDTMPSNGPERVERAKSIIGIAYAQGPRARSALRRSAHRAHRRRP